MGDYALSGMEGGTPRAHVIKGGSQGLASQDQGASRSKGSHGSHGSLVGATGTTGATSRQLGI
jgi:hypothetical protein